MRMYALFVLPFATLCVIATLGIQGLALIVAALSSGNVGNGMPLKFYEQVGLPLMSIALPVLGMLLFAACLPALRRGKKGEEPHLSDFLIKHPAHHQHGPGDGHFKAA
jgi:hypothetical protein